MTVGPGVSSSTHVVVLGEAAHITAAAPGGPRYDRGLTRDERRSVDNGIWMCRHHASLVDKDEANFSVATLRNWKQLAESRAAGELRRGDPSQSYIPVPTTLLAFGFVVVARGVWMSGMRESWRFKIMSFIRGDQESLRRYVEELDRLPEGERFIVVASQGDGRLISGSLSWEQKDGGAVEVTVPINPRTFKRLPESFGVDIAWSPEGDFAVENGRLRLVQGLDNAVQRLQYVLNTPLGSWQLYPGFGSLWADYYRSFKEDPSLLEELFKLDLARLATIARFDAIASRMERDYQPSAPLSFIERVQEVSILKNDLPENQSIEVFLNLTLVNGTPWLGKIIVSVASHMA